jgi:putative exosortase-associated protein (TIGR04073 family)
MLDPETKPMRMQKTFPYLAVLLLAGVLASGCANTEKKFGRGVSNVFEIVRGGEFRRTMEQTALFDGPDAAYGTGFFRGINRTFARTGVGIYEVVTAPFPPYDPVMTDYLAPGPVYPDNYVPIPCSLPTAMLVLAVAMSSRWCPEAVSGFSTVTETARKDNFGRANISVLARFLLFAAPESEFA